MGILTSEQESLISHLYILFPVEENVGKQIKWIVKMNLTLYTQLWV